jgi:hypothetical protein
VRDFFLFSVFCVRQAVAAECREIPPNHPPKWQRNGSGFGGHGLIRGALYVRVSTKEQTSENQERELRQWAERLGLEIIAAYADTMSGARSDRAALAAVLTAAHRREFDVLLVWALDRVSREGIARMVGYVEQLRAAGPPWTPADDPNADFRSKVAEYSRLDPLPTLENLSRNTRIPVGSLARFILVRYCTSGSDALLEMGPRVVRQMDEIIQQAEGTNTDAARLDAYRALKPLDDSNWRTGSRPHRANSDGYS